MQQAKDDILYSCELWKTMTSRKKSPNEQVELETRLGVAKSQGTKELYWNNAYKEVMKQSNRKTKSRYVNMIVSDGNIDYRKRESIWQMKSKKEAYNHPDLWMKISVSVETPSHEPPNIPNLDIGADKDVITRKIARHSFYIGKSSRVDFSKVYKFEGTSKLSTLSFEVEVEYMGNQKGASPKEYLDTVIFVHKSMFQTPLVFTYSSLILASGQANSFLSAIYPTNKTRGVRDVKYLNRSYFSEARALDLSLINYKGMFLNGGYYISPKTDGTRIFITLTSEGCFGLYPPNTAIQYSVSNYSRTSGLTIIDCELYNGEAWYIDTLYIEGNDVREFVYEDRRTEYRKWAGRITEKEIGVRLREKESIALTPDGFFDEITFMYNKLDKYDFDTDGIMFTPARATYLDSTLDSRIILKWKPEITIDLKVQDDKLLCSDDDALRSDIPFIGTKRAPFKGNVDMGDIVANQGSVVEFKCSDGNLIALRNRPEKLGPNTVKVCMDNWEKSIIDPVTPDTLMCSNNVLMRKYHGRIKRTLFMQNPGEILLDIGSGWGGDIAKWKAAGYSKIIAVEPSEKNIKTFKERLAMETPDIRLKVHILNSNGQNFKEIREFMDEHLGKKAKANVVSMMDSLTYFFDNESSLVSLKKTLDLCMRTDGTFLWKAMNGDLVKKAFEEADTDEIRFGKGKDYIKKEGEGLKVNIDPNVSTNEWYTDIDELKLVLNLEGEVNIASHEKLLSEDYLAFSSLYSYGAFKARSSARIPDAVRRVFFDNKRIPEGFELNKSEKYTSCIDLIESLFTHKSHNSLLQKYTEESYLSCPRIASSNSLDYTKFETVGGGYFTRKFFDRFPIKEKDVISNCDAPDTSCAFAFCDLLDLDVFIVDRKGRHLETNSIKDSDNPFLYVIYDSDQEVYYVKDYTLHPSSKISNEDRNKVPDISKIFSSATKRFAGKSFVFNEAVKLNTPVLLRCAYSDNLNDKFRILCLANYLCGLNKFKITEALVEEYFPDYEYESVKKSLERQLNKLCS